MKAQEEAEKERLLAEDEAEKQRELEEEAEEQRLQAESEEEKEMAEETFASEREEEASQAVVESSTAAAYQAKAEEFAIDKLLEMLDIGDSPFFLDARWLKTSEEFYEYCTTVWNDGMYVIGAVNTSIFEETENQYRIKVTILFSYREACYCTGSIDYFEVIIDKDTELRTIADYYWDDVGTYGPYAENKIPQGVIKHVHPDPSEWYFDPSE